MNLCKFKWSSILFLSSSLAISGTMGKVCDKQNVLTHCNTPGLGIGAQLLYLHPDLSALNFVGSTHHNGQSIINEEFIDKSLNYGFGFKIETFYNFSSGRDINLNWYHLENTYHQHLPNPTSVFDTSFFGNVNATYKPLWNAVNVELGQILELGSLGEVRLHGGVQYANLKMNHLTTGTVYLANTGISRTDYSTFEGAGMRIGSDFLADMHYGISLYAKVAASLITGHHNFKRTAYAYRLYASPTVDINYGSALSTIPELEGKLGVTYHYLIPYGDLRLEGGWMWASYFGAIEVANYGHNGRTQVSNFAVQGPFVGFNLAGNLF